jgi:hypothetical protein
MDSFEREFKGLNLSQINPQKLKAFVDANFYQPSTELVNCTVSFNNRLNK